MNYYWLEVWFTRLALCFLAGNPINVLMYGESGGQEVDVNAQGSFLEPGINAIIFLVSLTLVCFRWRQTLKQIKQGNYLILLLISIVTASMLWSEIPDISIRRSFLMIGGSVFGLYLATSFSFQQQLQHLCWAFIANTLINLLFCLGLPHYGMMRLDPHVGAWRGVYMHKQGLGIQMAMNIGFFLSLIGGKIFTASKWIIFSLVIATLLLVLSRSSTGLTLVAFSSVGIFISRILKFRLDFRISTFIALCSILIVLGVSFLMSVNTEQIAGVFGKDVSISGRDKLWEVVLEMVAKKPLLGYGYESFWPIEYRDVWQLIGWSAPHAHNGLLEVLLAVGWIGAIVTLATLSINLFRTINLIRVSNYPESIWPFIYLLYLVISNVTEKKFLGDGVVWSLYIWVSFLPTSSPLKVDTEAFHSRHLEMKKL